MSLKSATLAFPSVLCGLVALIGCSASQDVENGTYKVKSDCPGVTTSGTLNIDSKLVFKSKQGSYTVAGAEAFGFPTNIWEIKGPHLLTCSNESRICKTVVFTHSKSFQFFSCYDASEQELQCTIFLEK